MIVKNGIAVAYEVTGPSIDPDRRPTSSRSATGRESQRRWIKKNLGGNAQVWSSTPRRSPRRSRRARWGGSTGLKTGGPGVKLVAKQPIKLLTADEGSTLSATLLQAHPDIDVWLGDDDTIIGVRRPCRPRTRSRPTRST